eukprot:5567381-Alexandrium_andersonii.AAC.1
MCIRDRLLGSREDDHGGPVAGRVEHGDRLEDEVRSEEERVHVWGVGADDVCPKPEPPPPGSGGAARVDGVLE